MMPTRLGLIGLSMSLEYSTVSAVAVRGIKILASRPRAENKPEYLIWGMRTVSSRTNLDPGPRRRRENIQRRCLRCASFLARWAQDTAYAVSPFHSRFRCYLYKDSRSRPQGRFKRAE